MTGAELRAWRERLGKDEAWGAGVCAGLVFACYHEWPRESAAGSERRQAAEGEARWGYDQSEVSALRTAYHAALEAEERAQAERGPVEPVCPEGVWRGDEPHGWWYVSLPGTSAAPIAIEDGGRICFTELAPTEGASPALLRYAADLSEYRAAVHAASDRQRKLDAVRAAEAEAERMIDARDTAHRRFLDADNLRAKAELALATARREAGL